MSRTIKTIAGKEYFFSDQDEIGRGSFSIVYKGFEAHMKQVVAIKVLAEKLRDKRKNKWFREMAQREVDILQKLDHDPNLLKIIDTAEDENAAYIITNFYQGGNLRKLLNDSTFDESKAVKYLHQIVKGLSLLHQKGIMHRDIQLGNVILSNDRCVICDFGSALAQKTSDQRAGTPTYRAPELEKVKPGAEYTLQIDVWSMGVVFFKMLFGRKIHKEYQLILENDENGIHRFPKSPNVSIEAIQLLDKMLRVDPNQRITVQQILKDQLFNHDSEIEELKNNQIDKIKEERNQNHLQDANLVSNVNIHESLGKKKSLDRYFLGGFIILTLLVIHFYLYT